MLLGEAMILSIDSHQISTSVDRKQKITKTTELAMNHRPIEV